MLLRDFIVSLYGQTTYEALVLVARLYPIWLPILAGITFWELWVRYIRYLFFIKTEMVLLEVRIPRDVFKSPVAMELAILAFQQFSGEATFITKYWEGKVRPWFSLEIASFGGEIHFFIWTRKNLRDLVESQLYSQYPGIEVTEAADYARPVKFEPGKNDMWGCIYNFSKPDAYPIRTYFDFGLEKDPKEEFKNDPLTSVLEFMGSLKPGEQIWIQFIIRAHRSEKRRGLFSPVEDWRKAAEAEIKKIQKKIKDEGRTIPTAGEAELISGIERSLGKTPFDAGIRAVYFAETKEIYSSSAITGLRGLFKAFSSNNLNSLRFTMGTDFDYPWQDFRGVRANRMKRQVLDAYKRRMYFYYPYKFKNLVLTNEELATLYHFPGQVAVTPGLPRIPSKRGQAPGNLPT